MKFMKLILMKVIMKALNPTQSLNPMILVRISNKFEINFSSYQLIGMKNLENKSRLQIELYDMKTQKIIARSKTFLLSQLVKTISNNKSLRRTTVTNFDIKLNNLVGNSISK